jgi:hypothetical protein
MKAILHWLATLFVAFSIGTVISLAVLACMLWWKGALADDRVLGMLAVLQGIETPRDAVSPPGDPADEEQPSIEQLIERRLAASLDLDLRESAIDKTLGDLRALESQIKGERMRLDEWKVSFDQRLAALETQSADQALTEVQQALASMSPKQAKDQILRLLKDRDSPADEPMNDLVAVLKTMPDDKRRKIYGEFKSPEEAETLAEILRYLRLGEPDADLIRSTRSELNQQLQPQR